MAGSFYKTLHTMNPGIQPHVEANTTGPTLPDVATLDDGHIHCLTIEPDVSTGPYWIPPGRYLKWMKNDKRWMPMGFHQGADETVYPGPSSLG